MPPKPRMNWHKVFDTQMAVYAWYRTAAAREWMVESWRMNLAGVEHENTKAMSKDLYQQEMARLIDCDPIYVSADMCELIDFAQESFQPEPLLESDLITPRAFLMFETPFVIPDRFENMTEIKAVSWTRTLGSAGMNRDPEETLRITDAVRAMGGVVEEYEGGIRVIAGDMLSSADLEDTLIANGAAASGIALTIYATTQVERMHGEYRLYQYPPVLPIHLTPWYFHMTFEGNEVDIAGIPTGALWWWKIVQTTLRMMQQKVSVKHHVRPDRSTRREMQKHGYRPDIETVVIRLRGEEAERKDPSGESANYSHRFIRRGHWRNQPYPSEDLYRQIWIDPTIVGSKDLPLIVKPRRAFQWNR